MEQTVPYGTVHRTIGLLQSALTGLKAAIEPLEVERIGVTIHRAMSMQQRSFHTPEHIFDLSDPDDAHSTLAALFHNTVYYQVDGGFLREIGEILSPYISLEEGTIRIRQGIPRDNRPFFGTLGIFGFTPGQTPSPFGGLNEFLSALLMNVLLHGIVQDADLLIATAGIEMTIPFRGPDKEGLRPAERLEQRIMDINGKFGLDLQNSPLSLYIYRCLEENEITKGIEAARQYIRGEGSARDLLGAMPRHLAAAIARAASMMAFTRKKKLLEITAEYGGESLRRYRDNIACYGARCSADRYLKLLHFLYTTRENRGKRIC